MSLSAEAEQFVGALVLSDADFWKFHGVAVPDTRRDTGSWHRPGLPDGVCLICSSDEHNSLLCPYNVEVPKNATVASGCDVVCKVCDRLFSGGCCNQDTGRAKLKYCNYCFKYGEHSFAQWPRKPEFGIGDSPYTCTGRRILKVRKKMKEDVV